MDGRAKLSPKLSNKRGAHAQRGRERDEQAGDAGAADAVREAEVDRGRDEKVVRRHAARPDRLVIGKPNQRRGEQHGRVRERGELAASERHCRCAERLQEVCAVWGALIWKQKRAKTGVAPLRDKFSEFFFVAAIRLAKRVRSPRIELGSSRWQRPILTIKPRTLRMVRVTIWAIPNDLKKNIGLNRLSMLLYSSLRVWSHIRV